MLSNKRRLVFPVAVAGAVLFLGAVPAVAEDAFLDWGTVPTQELAEARGMATEVSDEALAKAIGAQHQSVIFDGVEVGAGGSNNLGTHTFEGQVMSLNIINSGHNNVFQAQNVIAVTIVDSSL